MSSSYENLPQTKRKTEPSSLLNKQLPFFKGQQVIVDTSNGRQSGEIKYIGSTEFAKGKWIGVALDEPTGELAIGIELLYEIVTILGRNNGTVNGREYFKCEDKHGLIVRQDKIKSP